MSAFFVGRYFLKEKNEEKKPEISIAKKDVNPAVAISLGTNYFKYKNSIYNMRPSFGNVDLELVATLNETNFNFYYVAMCNADFDSFQAINKYYGKDKNYIFIDSNILEGADVNTFEVIKDGFAKDKNRLYYNAGEDGNYSTCDNELVSKMNPGYFQIVGSFIKDDKLVYSKRDYRAVSSGCFYEEVKDNKLDAATFVQVNKNYYKDKNYIYENISEETGKSCLNEFNVDSESFEKINNCYFKDKSNVYFVENEKNIISFPVAVDSNIKSLDDCNYIFIADAVFYKGKKIESNIDQDSFVTIDENYVKDKKHLFYKGILVEEADPNDIKWVEDREGYYFISNNKVFFEGHKLIGADPYSISVMDDYSYVRDKKHVFSYWNQLEASDAKYDFSYFNLNGVKIFYKDAGSREYSLHLTKNGKTKQIYSPIIGDCCGGGFPIFRFTNNPDVALLESGTGDACFGLRQEIYIDTTKESTLFIENGYDCAYDIFNISNQKDNYAFNFIVVDEQNKPIDYKQNKPTDYNKDECQLGKKYSLSGFSFSKDVVYSYDKKININCITSEDTGQKVFATPSISYEGLSIDLKKIYFSINNLDNCKNSFYDFNLIDKKIESTDNSNTNLLRPYKD